VRTYDATAEGLSRGRLADDSSVPAGDGSFLATMLKRLFAGAGVVRTPFESPAHFIVRQYALARKGRALSLVMFGFVDFEAFAERAGATATGEAVREFSRVLDRAARTLNVTVRAGWRGDSFLVALPSADATTAAAYVDAVRHAADGSKVRMPSFAAGVVECGPAHRSPDALVRAAEHALVEVRYRTVNGAPARRSPATLVAAAAGRN
jgi:GGDEF domain-containing protein